MQIKESFTGGVYIFSGTTQFKTKAYKSLRDSFLPSKAAIKLEGVDGDGKGGLFPFLSLTPPPSVQSVGF